MISNCVDIKYFEPSSWWVWDEFSNSQFQSANTFNWYLFLNQIVVNCSISNSFERKLDVQIVTDFSSCKFDTFFNAITPTFLKQNTIKYHKLTFLLPHSLIASACCVTNEKGRQFWWRYETKKDVWLENGDAHKMFFFHSSQERTNHSAWMLECECVRFYVLNIRI
jgi:hypothetical protein